MHIYYQYSGKDSQTLEPSDCKGVCKLLLISESVNYRQNTDTDLKIQFNLLNNIRLNKQCLSTVTSHKLTGRFP